MFIHGDTEGVRGQDPGQPVGAARPASARRVCDSLGQLKHVCIRDLRAVAPRFVV